jgi:hypothetical protein
MQAVVGAQYELLAGVGGLADDALAIDVESDDLEFPHIDLLGLIGHPNALSTRNRADTQRCDV